MNTTVCILKEILSLFAYIVKRNPAYMKELRDNMYKDSYKSGFMSYLTQINLLLTYHILVYNYVTIFLCTVKISISTKDASLFLY